MLSLVVVIVSGQMLLMFSSHCMSSCREDGFIRREREMHGSMAGFARVVGGGEFRSSLKGTSQDN